MSRTRREFLKFTAVTAAVTASAEALPRWSSDTTVPSGEIQVWITGHEKHFERGPSLAWQSQTAETQSDSIFLNPAERFQEILGFGGAFTDAACYMFSQLSVEARQKLFHELFHPTEMGLNVCRTCIGASDYSTELYGFDEGEPDPELKRFSIDHDKTYLLPILREARKVNPDLFLLSSPWSPPGWMKANNSMLGGSMRKKYFGSYAQHFVKFLRAYTAEGVPIQAVTTQNEVDTDQDGRMPACLWGQEYEIEFIAKHLGPALQTAGLNTKIWLLDHNYDLWGRVICSLDVEDVRKHCSAVAWHGYVGSVDMISRVHAAHPNVSMHWTEGGPDYTSPTYATDWSTWAGVCTEALNHWCSSVIAWNLALDEMGRPNIGPFPCGGLVTIHSQTKEITHSGEYRAINHFSRSIRRGARRFASMRKTKSLAHVACENPDGQKILIVTNPGSATKVSVQMGKMTTQVSLESDSVTTLAWKG